MLRASGRAPGAAPGPPCTPCCTHKASTRAASASPVPRGSGCSALQQVSAGKLSTKEGTLAVKTIHGSKIPLAVPATAYGGTRSPRLGALRI